MEDTFFCQVYEGKSHKGTACRCHTLLVCFYYIVCLVSMILCMGCLKKLCGHVVLCHFWLLSLISILYFTICERKILWDSFVVTVQESLNTWKYLVVMCQ